MKLYFNNVVPCLDITVDSGEVFRVFENSSGVLAYFQREYDLDAFARKVSIEGAISEFADAIEVVGVEGNVMAHVLVAEIDSVV